MPNVKKLLAAAGRLVLQRLYVPRVAVLPVAHDDTSRAVLREHRGADERRQQRRVRDGLLKLGVEKDTIESTTLQAAGYQTGLFGKYLNGYPRTPRPRTTSRPGGTSGTAPSAGQPLLRIQLHVERERQTVQGLRQPRRPTT